MVSTQIESWEIAGAFFVLIVGAFVFREMVCWYWKINEAVAVLTEIRDLMREANGKAPAA